MCSTMQIDPEHHQFIRRGKKFESPSLQCHKSLGIWVTFSSHRIAFELHCLNCSCPLILGQGVWGRRQRWRRSGRRGRLGRGRSSGSSASLRKWKWEWFQEKVKVRMQPCESESETIQIMILRRGRSSGSSASLRKWKWEYFCEKVKVKQCKS